MAKYTTQRVIDQLAPTRRPRNLLGTDAKIGLGSIVSGPAQQGPSPRHFGYIHSVQVWSKADFEGYWWVTDGSQFYRMVESSMEVTAQAQDEALFEVA